MRVTVSTSISFTLSSQVPSSVAYLFSDQWYYRTSTILITLHYYILAHKSYHTILEEPIEEVRTTWLVIITN